MGGAHQRHYRHLFTLGERWLRWYHRDYPGFLRGSIAKLVPEPKAFFNSNDMLRLPYLHCYKLD